MSARSLRTAIAFGLVLCLASCASIQARMFPRPLVYYVRNVMVIADARLPLDLIAGVDARVSAAIAATRPPQGAERVVLMVKIDRLDHGEGARRRMERAHFTVTATSVDTGEPVAEGKYVVNAPTDDPRFALGALAEEIAARIRFDFSLAHPLVRSVPAPKTLSTRLKTDPEMPSTPTPRATPLVSGRSAPAKPAVAAAPAVPTPPAAPKPAPVEMAAPPVLPVTTVEKPAYPDQPALPVSEPKPGTTVEQGASGTVRLGGGCDPTVATDCLTPKP
ncbi:hypothetical protein ASE36_18105 [Rhizobium sp. Root274]|uniref:hypothetical protein n=1 Tax=unclassified Rhizobium TaxID=2613769 RepID=UPI000713C838|nr:MULTISPECIES: hypothetical protein [unclassified Rhizobium]KQW27671.1 hypothetical protein ASC71_18130 [Rhizobium sp. Root1240]KRD28001.1 hypothetical protein ASE36_18105 [Rhizobium sp. Root274]